MKKLLLICLAAFTLFTACSGDSYTDETENNTTTHNETPAEIPNEAPDDILACNIVDAMEHLAGAWDLVAAGLLIHVQSNGDWETSWGDIGFRGNVELTPSNGGYYIQFIIHEMHGPGATHDNYGNIREGAFNPETNEFYWIPHPEAYSVFLFGTFSVEHDRLTAEGIWTDAFDPSADMERVG